MDVLKLSSDLMSFKSISPKSAGSLEFIQDLLNKWGFDCHLLEFGESKVKNLYACFTGGKGPNVCLLDILMLFHQEMRRNGILSRLHLLLKTEFYMEEEQVI